MHELLYYAAAAGLREENGMLVGEPIELHLTRTARHDGVEDRRRGAARHSNAPSWPPRRTSGGSASQVLADGGRVAASATPGRQRHLPDGRRRRPSACYFAVNVPSSAATTRRTARATWLGRPARRGSGACTYPEWDLQVVTDLSQVDHTKTRRPPPTATEVSYAPQGGPVARVLLLAVLCLALFEVLLAWLFGHYSATATKVPGEQIVRHPFWQGIAWLLPWAFFGMLCSPSVAVLVHDAFTGDFLSFLPQAVRSGAERWLGVPPPSIGEGTRWRLEYSSYFHSDAADPWLVGLLIAVAAIGIIGAGLLARGRGRRGNPDARCCSSACASACSS